MSTLSGWTDYPRAHLGEKGLSPFRKITAMKYDGDKYLRFDTGESFKRGYFYRNRRKSQYRLVTLERRLPVGWLEEP